MSDNISKAPAVLVIPAADAFQLARFCRQANLNKVDIFAEDGAEAIRMTNAILNLGDQLERQGFRTGSYSTAQAVNNVVSAVRL